MSGAPCRGRYDEGWKRVTPASSNRFCAPALADAIMTSAIPGMTSAEAIHVIATRPSQHQITCLHFTVESGERTDSGFDRSRLAALDQACLGLKDTPDLCKGTDQKR